MAGGEAVSKEQVEAFGLGASLGKIEVSVANIASDVSEVKQTTSKTSGDVTELKVALAAHAGRLDAHGGRLDGHDRELKEIRLSDPPSRLEHDQLRQELASGRLTWGKLLAGLAAVGGIVIGGGALLLQFAVSLGAFSR